MSKRLWEYTETSFSDRNWNLNNMSSYFANNSSYYDCQTAPVNVHVSAAATAVHDYGHYGQCMSLQEHGDTYGTSQLKMLTADYSAQTQFQNPYFKNDRGMMTSTAAKPSPEPSTAGYPHLWNGVYRLEENTQNCMYNTTCRYQAYGKPEVTPDAPRVPLYPWMTFGGILCSLNGC